MPQSSLLAPTQQVFILLTLLYLSFVFIIVHLSIQMYSIRYLLTIFVFHLPPFAGIEVPQWEGLWSVWCIDVAQVHGSAFAM